MLKVYHYPKCSTCRKATAFLAAKNLDYKLIDIVETPPTQAELKKMLGSLNGETKKLFNTSGQLYREMRLKNKIETFGPQEAIQLLSQHGKLIKRPFVLGKSGGTVGFKETDWTTLFG